MPENPFSNIYSFSNLTIYKQVIIFEKELEIMERFKPVRTLLIFATAFILCCRSENYQPSLSKNFISKMNLLEYPGWLEEIAPYRSTASLIQPQLFESMPDWEEKIIKQCWVDWVIILEYTKTNFTKVGDLNLLDLSIFSYVSTK